ncbi:hypothetical protein [Legionella hackeliae]|uniref:Uncharacterized protein n=1 Tax=Legionella hackeliae TaxID=449 RepID=A0A0A8UW47_LEGHA|nr:hypothetical protein [Legionella hackeliae]KTD09687.1 hypothetical protein Lhac_2055 [Legionella hackeliae]CEK10989.1 protein of unknown function [Legionella hackeliae]STX47729.1 Uncharacterised protein [Legionella hackeliae]
MRYVNMGEIKKYARDVQAACERTGVAARFPADTWEGNAAYVVEAQQELSAQPTKQNFEKYAQAIFLAAGWLKEDVGSDRTREQAFLTPYIVSLQAGVNHFLNINIPAPKRVVYDPEDKLTPAAQIFFRSQVFKQLLAYRDFLKNGRNNHFFGLLHFKKDYDVLNELINALNAQKSIEGIQAVFEDFYHEQVQNGYTRYDSINRGQDILNYILRLFGIKEKTSTALLEELSHYAENTTEYRSENERQLTSSTV